MSDDYAATTSTTGTVAVGGSATGEIERRRDIDWFSVELEAGTTYVVDLKGSGDDPLARARLVGLYDSDGAGISGVRGVGDGAGGSWLTFTATESGTYYIAAGGKGNRQGTYTVEVREEVQEVADPDPALQPDPVQGQQQQNVPTVDADATAAGATELGDLNWSGGRVARDSVDGGDDRTDYYKFTLTEQQAVTLSLRRQDADADLFLEDGDGNVLAFSMRGGTRGETIAETLEAGTYYVRVAAQEAGDNDYTLRAKAQTPPSRAFPDPLAQRNEAPIVTSVSEPAGADFMPFVWTQGQVAVGGSVTGTITDYADRDWYAVTFEEGKTYQIDLKMGAGKYVGSEAFADCAGDPWAEYEALGNPYLYGIHDANGKLIAGTSNDDIGYGSISWDEAGPDDHYSRDSRVVFTATETATHFVDAGGFGYHSGKYTLSVEEVVDAM